VAIDQLDAVIQRLSRDASFRRKYCVDPDSALRHYLSPSEIRIIKSGDGQQLHALGAGHKWEELTAALCGPHPGP
jgi:hypothetical protein